MPIATPEWMAKVDGVQPIPADGDDYAYRGPLIPRQWVPVAEHDEVLARVAELEKRVAELWKILAESGREQLPLGGG